MRQKDGVIRRGRALRSRSKSLIRRSKTIAAVGLLVAATSVGWSLLAAGQNEVTVRNAVSDALSAGAEPVGEKGLTEATSQPARAVSTSAHLPLLDSLATLHAELVELSSALDAAKRSGLADSSLVSVRGSVGENTDHRTSRSLDSSDFVTRSLLAAQSDEIHSAFAASIDASVDELGTALGQSLTTSALTVLGNVGIGTTSPRSKLVVDGQITLGTTATTTDAAPGTVAWDGADLFARVTTAPGGWRSLTRTNEIDVFLVAGQSNAQGHGDASLSPTPEPGTAFQYDAGSISAAVDPVGNASTGSAWPSFAIAYYSATGRKVAFVPTAVGGSAQTAAADDGAGNWSPSGALFDASLTQVNEALGAFADAGYVPVFRGVLWAQGEKDASEIHAGTITVADYKSALQTMIADYRDAFGTSMPFYIVRLGARTTAVEAGFAEVRNAQEEVARSDGNTQIAVRTSADFISRDGYLEPDGVHYSQYGLNELGRIAAANIVSAGSHSLLQLVGTSTLNAYFTDGNLGIGSTNPTAKLTVSQSGTSGAPAFLVEDAESPDSSPFVITETGNVGIATLAPRAPLDVSSGGLTGGLLIGADIFGTTRSDDTRKFGVVSAPHYDSDEEDIVGFLFDSSQTYSRLSIGGGNGSLNGVSEIAFYTSADTSTLAGTRRLTIASSGNVGIGTTSPSAQLTTTGSVRFATFGAGSLQSDANGNLSVSSDERLKTDISSFDRSLADVLQIEPINYRWREETGFDTEHVYSGFSAQDVKEVIPEAVGVDRNGMLTLTDRPILAAVVNAVKALNAHLTALSDTIAGYAYAFTSERLNARQLCLDDLCITREELAEMLDEANVDAVDPAPTAGSDDSGKRETASSTTEDMASSTEVTPPGKGSGSATGTDATTTAQATDADDDTETAGSTDADGENEAGSGSADDESEAGDPHTADSDDDESVDESGVEEDSQTPDDGQESDPSANDDIASTAALAA